MATEGMPGDEPVPPGLYSLQQGGEVGDHHLLQVRQQDAAAHPLGDGLVAVHRPCLAGDLIEVVVHGALRDAEDAGDLPDVFPSLAQNRHSVSRSVRGSWGSSSLMLWRTIRIAASKM